MRLIDANAMMKRICGHECGMHPEDCDGMESETVPCNFHAYVSEAPTIDAQPVKHGKWDDSYDGITPVCTVCGKTHSCIRRNPDYCPNCGAKMEA